MSLFELPLARPNPSLVLSQSQKTIKKNKTKTTAETKIGSYKDSQQQTSCVLYGAKTQQKYYEFDPPCRSYEQGQIKIESQFRRKKKYHKK